MISLNDQLPADNKNLGIGKRIGDVRGNKRLLRVSDSCRDTAVVQCLACNSEIEIPYLSWLSNLHSKKCRQCPRKAKRVGKPGILVKSQAVDLLGKRVGAMLVIGFTDESHAAVACSCGRLDVINIPKLLDMGKTVACPACEEYSIIYPLQGQTPYPPEELDYRKEQLHSYLTTGTWRIGNEYTNVDTEERNPLFRKSRHPRINLYTDICGAVNGRVRVALSKGQYLPKGRPDHGKIGRKPGALYNAAGTYSDLLLLPFYGNRDEEYLAGLPRVYEAQLDAAEHKYLDMINGVV